MSLEQLNAPPANVIAVPTTSTPCCEVVVRTADGRTFNLGKPSSWLFPIRRRIYMWRRRHEMKEKANG